MIRLQVQGIVLDELGNKQIVWIEAPVWGESRHGGQGGKVVAATELGRFTFIEEGGFDSFPKMSCIHVKRPGPHHCAEEHCSNFIRKCPLHNSGDSEAACTIKSS